MSLLTATRPTVKSFYLEVFDEDMLFRNMSQSRCLNSEFDFNITSSLKHLHS